MRLLPPSRQEPVIELRQIERLLRSEIVGVAGCTEPASVAFAFLTARRHLKGTFDPRTATAHLVASREVLRNASTAVVPFLNRRGLQTVVAAGLSSRTKEFNLFPRVDPSVTRILKKRRNWLTVGPPARQMGVYVRAVLSTPRESVTVIIAGRHDEIRSINRNGRIVFRLSPRREPRLSMPEIVKVAVKRDRRLESIVRNFLVCQVRGKLDRPMPGRVADLIRARMCGSPASTMTIVGSGNHGILLGVPFYELYRARGSRILPAAVFSLLTVIHMTQKRSRISDACGLATKAAPALAAGLAFLRGASLQKIRHVMDSVSRELRSLKCHGARASCGEKAQRVLNEVMGKYSVRGRPARKRDEV